MSKYAIIRIFKYIIYVRFITEPCTIRGYHSSIDEDGQMAELAAVDERVHHLLSQQVHLNYTPTVSVFT